MKTPLSFKDISIIVALGNPGSEYANTYHNVGVQFIRFINENCFNLPKTVELLGTFMNVSGPALQKQLKKDELSPDRLLLVHDDVDIPLGEYKLSFGSGAAGHHGVESAIASLGTKDFWRLRVGIAKTIEKPDGTMIKKKADTYVLKPIAQKDGELIQAAFDRAVAQLNG